MCELEWDTDEEVLAWQKKWSLMKGWDRQGIQPAGLWEELAAEYLATENCQLCGLAKRLVVEHVHLPIKGNVRSICCHKCNSNIRIVDANRRRLLKDIRMLAHFARMLRGE
jgi:hypothetical protein